VSEAAVSGERPVQLTVTVTLTPEQLDAIAERAAERVAQRSEPSRWMTVEEAAEHARCSRQHIYDLRSDGRLSRHGEHGHALVDRRELDAYLDNTAR
jgi:excisionase family DNA binding protein